MVGGFGLLGAGYVVMGTAETMAAIVAGGLLLGVGGGVTAPLQKSLVTQLAPMSVRAGSVSAAFIFQSLGQTVGPLAVGVVLVTVPVGGTFVLVGVAGAALGGAVMTVAYLLACGSSDAST
jgi:MFS family permease